jgi:hypothetical protein
MDRRKGGTAFGILILFVAIALYAMHTGQIESVGDVDLRTYNCNPNGGECHDNNVKDRYEDQSGKVITYGCKDDEFCYVPPGAECQSQRGQCRPESQREQHEDTGGDIVDADCPSGEFCYIPEYQQ